MPPGKPASRQALGLGTLLVETTSASRDLAAAEYRIVADPARKSWFRLGG